MKYKVWDKRNRLVESRLTATGALLGSFTYNERGLRVKAIRTPQPTVQVIEPNGGESFHVGATDTISWSGVGLENALVKLELLKDGAVAGTIVENLPGTQTSYAWQAGKLLSGWAAAGTGYKVRVTAVVPVGGPETAYYFYDSGGRLLSEYDGTGACVKDYLYLGGKMIGEFVPSSTSYYYYGSDQINSTRMVTDSSGTVVYSAQYDPYGGLYKTWVDTYHPRPGFSGKERESGSEMDYFGARYYGHGQYRFLSVDPIINKDEAITDPQKWNLYAYCSNSPICHLDPDGRAGYSSQFNLLQMPETYKKALGDKVYHQIQKQNAIGATISSGAMAAVGFAIAVGPAALEAALVLMAKHPSAVQNIVSGALNPNPPDSNLPSLSGWGINVLSTGNWKDYAHGVTETAADVRNNLNTVFNNIANKVTEIVNRINNPRISVPYYRGQ